MYCVEVVDDVAMVWQWLGRGQCGGCSIDEVWVLGGIGESMCSRVVVVGVSLG